MSLPVEINFRRVEGDTYAIVFSVATDYSAYTIALETVSGSISPSIVTSTSLTFPGTVIGNLEVGPNPYKVVVSSPIKTIIWGIIQIDADNLP
jgi:hypothetical protein